MRHGHLDDACPARENERFRELLPPDRAEHRLDRAAPVRVERAAEVRDVGAGETAEHSVHHERRQLAAPGVLPHLARAAGDVGAGLDRLDEPRQVLGLVLEVAVHRHEDLAARADEPGVHGRVLPEVALEADRAHAPVRRVDALELGERRVGRAVVDEDELERATRGVESGGGPLVELPDVLALVVDGNHDRDRRRRRVGVAPATAAVALLAGCSPRRKSNCLQLNSLHVGPGRNGRGASQRPPARSKLDGTTGRRDPPRGQQRAGGDHRLARRPPHQGGSGAGRDTTRSRRDRRRDRAASSARQTRIATSSSTTSAA